MNVVAVSAGDPHPAHLAALRGLSVRRVNLAGDPYAYGRLLGELWATGEEFCVVEGDIAPQPATLAGLAGCPREWCPCPYPGPGGVTLTRSLGCTRFSAGLLAAHPTLVADALGVDDSTDTPPGHWARLDVRVAGLLTAAGVNPHPHPAVAHHHNYG